MNNGFNFKAEQEMLANYLSAQERTKNQAAAGNMVMDFGAGPEDVSKYMQMRQPGTQFLKMVADPFCILKDGEALRAKTKFPTMKYCWRNPRAKFGGRIVKQGVHQGWLRAVYVDEVDFSSPHAMFEETLIPTSEGRRKQVSLQGNCLYEISEEKCYEWFVAPVDYYKGELASMQYSQADSLRSAGFSPPQKGADNFFSKADTAGEPAVGY
jgi:hypothetical protein